MRGLRNEVVPRKLLLQLKDPVNRLAQGRLQRNGVSVIPSRLELVSELNGISDRVKG